MLELAGKLPLSEKAHVKVTIQAGIVGSEDVERSAWLKHSEAALTKTWANPNDDVLNELLKRRARPAADAGPTVIYATRTWIKG